MAFVLALQCCNHRDYAIRLRESSSEMLLRDVVIIRGVALGTSIVNCNIQHHDHTGSVTIYSREIS